MSTDVPVTETPVTVDAPVTTEVPTAPAEPRKPKKPISVYTVMLGIALFAICLACLFLFLEWNSYNREIIPGKPLF
jgi:hypothetical protein